MKNKIKKALITGITGMDGSHLADLLLSKNYKVFGLERHRSDPNRKNIEHIIDKIKLIKGDLSDINSLQRAITISQPDEIYNFASQSFVGDSWALPEHTANVTGLGVLRMLEAIKTVNPKIKFLQASSSEMFGKLDVDVANEGSRFYPKSPYGVAKVFGHHIVQNYKESYNLFACCSICFNHEGPRRGIQFVTRKISDGVAKIHLGLNANIHLGNLEPRRDWGLAEEYVEGIWMMLQQDQPKDFVFATGESHSVQDFVEEAFKVIGRENWQDYVVKDTQFVRPVEVDYLKGDSGKAKRILGWEAKVKFPELVKRMVINDIDLLREKYGTKKNI
jgi:GDPmannose 4,6-dehydratase